MTGPEKPRTDRDSTPNPRSLRIASVMLIILLIAVGLGVFLANRWVGILVVASAVPALIWVIFEARRRNISGRPMNLDEGVRGFAFSLGNIFLVLVASAIAFFATCFPIGLMGFEGENGGIIVPVAFGVGGLSALGVGALVAYRLRRYHRGRGAKAPKEEDR